MPHHVHTCLAAALALTACGEDAGTDVDAGVDAAADFACDTPSSIVLSPSTDRRNAGVPTAVIGWTDGRCVLYDDETHADGVLAIADTEEALGAGLVAARANRWVIESSSHGSAPTTYIANLPRDMDITMELRREDATLSFTFRVVAETLTLLDASQL